MIFKSENLEPNNFQNIYKNDLNISRKNNCI